MILPYLIKSTLCLSVLLLFFKLILEQKAMHQFKRFYLLAAIIFSFTLPLITFTYEIEVEVVTDNVWVENFKTAYNQEGIEETTTIQPEVERNITPIILWSIYVLGVLLFGSRFTVNLIRLRQKITIAQKINEKEFTLALLKQSIVPHSFLKWIFISKTQYKQQEIAPEILAHEATHVRQKHSWDILFIECIQVFFWFNPLIWFTKKSIKLNHEFLADQGVIDNNRDIAIYQNLLLRYASSSHHTTLESPFNYSLTKKRIIMLSQSFSRKKLFFRALLLIPVIATCAIAFNQAIIPKAKPVPDIAIIGEWVDQENESTIINIYHQNDTLWYHFSDVYKYPIYKNDTGYYLQSDYKEKEKIYIKKSKNENILFFGSNNLAFIPSHLSKKASVVGTWENKEIKTTYTFSLYNNHLICDISKEGLKTARYYPILKDNLITFTIGYNWVSFTRKGNQIIDNKGIVYDNVILNEEKQNLPILGEWLDKETEIVTTRIYIESDTIWYQHYNSRQSLIEDDKGPYLYDTDIDHKFYLEVNNDGELQFYPNSKKFVRKSNSIKQSMVGNWKKENSLETIKFNLDKVALTGYLSINEKKKERFVATIKDEGITFSINGKARYFKRDRDKLIDNKGAIYSRINNSQQNSYASQFIEGAKRNGKKPLVIEIKNNTIKVNNKPSSKETFVKDINTITKGWIAEDFKNPAQSYLFKDNSDTFIKTLEKEYAKTQIANKTGNSKLMPPAPPAPSSLQTLPAPQPLPSPKDHLSKMNNLGATFFYENKEITYKKARELLKKNSNLNVNTTYPYGTSPKTFISRSSFTQDASYKKGDTITVTVTDTGQKAFAIMDSDKKGTVIDKKPEDAGVGEKELYTYNSLVKRLNLATSKENNLTKEDIKLLKSIYIHMNEEQRAANEPYPLAPPTIEDSVKNELEEMENLHLIYNKMKSEKNN